MCNGRERLPRLTPVAYEARTHQRVFHARTGVEIPGVAGTARTAARFVIGQIGPRARVIRLLRFPGDDAALDVDLPGTGSGAVDAMRRTHDFVVLPAFAVAFFPTAIFTRGDTMPAGEGVDLFRNECQPVEKLRHCPSLSVANGWRRRKKSSAPPMANLSQGFLNSAPGRR